MRPTALKMAKNQGLDSVSQNKKNKKNKNKKFREKAAERRIGGYGGCPYAKRVENSPLHGGVGFIKYVPIYDVRSETQRSPAGAAAGLLRGCCYAPMGRGCCCGAAAMGTGEAERGGRAAAHERVTGRGGPVGGPVANVPKSP